MGAVDRPAMQEAVPGQAYARVAGPELAGCVRLRWCRDGLCALFSGLHDLERRGIIFNLPSAPKQTEMSVADSRQPECLDAKEKTSQRLRPRSRAVGCMGFAVNRTMA